MRSFEKENATLSGTFLFLLRFLRLETVPREERPSFPIPLNVEVARVETVSLEKREGSKEAAIEGINGEGGREREVASWAKV